MFKEKLKKVGNAIKNFFIIDNPNKLFRLNIVTILVVAVGLMTLGVFNESHAAEPEEGDTWTLNWVNKINYNLPGEGFQRYRYKLVSKNGNNDIWAFCIDHDVNELCNGMSRTSVSIEDPSAPYWSGLTLTAKRGVSIAATYGFRDNDSIPTELNGQLTADDMWWATQCVIWEYTEGIRTSATQDLSTSESPMYASLKGTKAEVGYNYILKKIRSHLETPSFTERQASNVGENKVIVLKHSYTNNNWTATVNDTNKVHSPAITLEDPDAAKPVTMKQNIDADAGVFQYTFTSTEAINSNKTLKFEKKVGNKAIASLVWSRGDTKSCQTMFSGSTPYDFYFYAKVRTEKPGYFTGEKVSDDADKHEDGIQDVYKDIKFQVTGNGLNAGDMIVTVNNEGKLTYNGSTKIQLYPGTYTITEISLPDRYRQPITKTFEVEEGATVNITGLINDIKEGYIHFQKYYRETEENAGEDVGQSGYLRPEPGAVFRVYAKDYADKGWTYDNIPDKWKAEATTDSNGKFTTKALPYGYYYVEQISGLESTFKCDKITVKIEKDKETYSFTCMNENVHSKLKIVKKDLETGKIIPYAGISFKIKDSSGNYVTMSDKKPTPSKIDTFTTDESGTVELPGHLPYGTYTIVEVKAPEGYYRNPEGATFTVDQESIENANDGKPNTFEKPIIVEFKDTPQKVDLNIIKTGEQIKEEDGKTEVIEAPLAYAEFELIAAEDIVTPEGTVRFTKGHSFGKVKTDAEGKASYTDLYLGKYELYERAVYNRELVYTFTDEELLSAETKYRELYSQNEQGNNTNIPEIIDTADQTTTTTSSQDEDDNELQEKLQELNTLMEGKVYKDNTGALYKEADKEAIVDDMFIETLNYVINLKSSGIEERFVERKDYQIPTEPIEIFEFEYTDQDTKVQTVERTYKNELATGKLELSKTDVSTGEVIPGAGIRVYDSSKNIICEGESDKNGKLTCDKLPIGTYYFQEYDAPAGYIIDDSLFKFEVKTKGEIVKAKMTNKKEEVDVPKTDRDKTYAMYIISAIMILIGSLASVGYIKREELGILFGKIKKRFGR